MKLPSHSRSDAKRLVIACLVLVVLAAVQPFLWRAVRASAQRLQDSRTQQEQLELVNSRINDINNTFASEQPLLDQLFVSFPFQGEVPQIVEHIERVAQQHGLAIQIQSILDEPSNKRSRSAILPLHINVQASGSASALLEFIDDLEHLQELVQIQTWAIQPQPLAATSPPALGAGSFTLSASIVFYLQQPNDATQ